LLKATPTIATDRGNMHRSFLASALLLLAAAAALTACGPVDPAYYPAMAQAPQPDLQGTATVKAQEYQAAIYGTSIAQTAVSDRATATEGVLQGTSVAVINQIQAQKEGTREAVIAQLTSDASTLRLTQAARDYAATDTAYPATVTGQAIGTQTAAPPTATAAQATAIYQALLIEQNAEDAKRNAAWRDALAVLKCGTAFLGLFAAYTLVFLVYHLIERKFRVLVTPTGPLQWNGARYEIVPLYSVDPADGYRGPHIRTNGWDRLNHASAAPAAVVEQLSPSVYASPMPSRSNGVHVLGIKLLKAARDVVGGESDKLPRWDSVDGATSEKWQGIIRALEAKGLVYTRPSVGTYIQGGNLDTVLYKLETGQVFLEPAE
jgi:predicted small lipoprotein YifL